VRGRGFAPALCLLTLVPAIAASHAYAADCQDWVARTVSTQGRVEARRAGEPRWLPVRLGDIHCLGDAIRLGPLSRAAIVLRDGGVLRLDQNTTITFTPPAERVSTWIDLLTGAVHFFSRAPRGLRITTPFVNGTVEGTEFLVEVDPSEARISVWEGRVLAENAQGSLALTSGQSAAARAGQAPMLRPIVVRPTDAVAWALYYPPVLDLRPEDFPDRPGETWPAEVRRSIAAAQAGDVEAALASLARLGDPAPDPRIDAYRASLLLSVGRVEEAGPAIERALALDPGNAAALALRTILAITRNERTEAMRFADEAVARDPASVAARIAQSYARQAAFDLNGARESLEAAVRLDPASALARARLAELWLAQRRVDEALEEADRAVRLGPTLGRTHAVLGFVRLARLEVRQAAETFERSIELDPTAPLPRLGLGLAKIRRGDLAGGRQELEIAVSLDPGDSLLRSYLGKAFYEERNPVLAAEQFSLARELDPKDPTPWLYDAIRLQSVNRPVEALQSLQRSIELNDNRAIYRSRLLLDEDLATRSASLARIYDDLGFQQRALVEGWKSVNADPTSYSAHRFLSDSYSALPRHDTARVSELLQSQLLQPSNVLPVQPQQLLNNPFILAGAGPAEPSFNEFNALFDRNRLSLLASGLVAGNSTYGDQVVLYGTWNALSFSLGQLHYETEGFRPNNDLTQNVYDAFLQLRLSHKTSIQAEYLFTEQESGDLPLRFDPSNFSPSLRLESETSTFRLGLRHALTPTSDLIGSFLYERRTFVNDLVFLRDRTDEDTYSPELQYILRSTRFSLVAGAGYYGAQETNTFTGDTDTRHVNVYGYSQMYVGNGVTGVLGGSVDSLSSPIDDVTQVNPKLGLIWTPRPETTLRAAAFRMLRRPLISGRSIEPTQVAGFNQLFDDATIATDSWRYGIGVDQRFGRSFYAGAEFSRRELTPLPIVAVNPETGDVQVERADWREDLGRAYLYWTLGARIVLSAEYLYEVLNRDVSNVGEARVVESQTHRVPLGIAWFDPSGLSARVRATYVDQSGRFLDAAGDVVQGSDQFWVVDASIGYRLPKRFGLITVEARNLLDEHFRFNDADARNPTIYPERIVLLRFTLAY
jgi:tetratricopeptide (TPR) repeat protein